MRLHVCDICGKAADTDNLCDRCRAVVEARAEADPLPFAEPTHDFMRETEATPSIADLVAALTTATRGKR